MEFTYILAVIFMLNAEAAPVPIAYAKDKEECMQKLGRFTTENKHAIMAKSAEGALPVCLKIELPSV
jgi:hypothetical protein